MRIEALKHTLKRCTKAHTPAHVSEKHVDLFCAEGDPDAQAQTTRRLFASLDVGRSREVALGDPPLRNVQLEGLVGVRSINRPGGGLRRLTESFSAHITSRLRQGDLARSKDDQAGERDAEKIVLQRGDPPIGCEVGAVGCLFC